MAADAGQSQPELLTAAELARALGVSASTIWNWTKREPNPLRTVTTTDGAIRFTWIQLNKFREAHPRLRGVSKADRYARSPDEPSPAQTAVAPQAEELKSIARDLRNAAHASLQGALEAARLAEETARSHRLQLEHFAQMMDAYDAALTNITAPSTVND
jgi:transcriptional regulator with XRE-family HTH domain